MLERYRRIGHGFDYWLALVIFVLSVFGVIMIFSASAVVSYERFNSPYGYASKQAMALGIGLVAWFVMTMIDYRFWQKKATVFLVITIVLLLAVFLPGIGIERNGAHRWIDLGSFSLQPSELIKLFFLMYISAWLSKKGEKINDLNKGIIPFVIILLVVIFLIMKEPDMGTMSVIAVFSMAVFFVSGVAWHYLLIFMAGAIALFRVLIYAAPYRLQRLMVFLNPNQAQSGAGYHINQALLALGSGGLLGLGFGQSKQKYLFLPEAHTDSIFAIIGEELGFLRAALVILAFVFIAWRGLEIAKRAPDKFGQLVATGITVWFIWQAFVNIGAMLGLLPLTGVPLPFISYGGTSLVVSFAAAGILLNISKQTT
ncbi:MAG: putative lipid II flippase FtsW [bacterium]|nr:putative lipid II flippase FtsW [bacterium]